MTESPDQPELWQALLPVIDVLEALDVAYLICGSVASSFSGVARATQDADIVADLRVAQGLAFVEALEDAYYIPERILSAIRERNSFNLVHLETAFKVDIFVMQDTAYARRAMARRVALEVPGVDRKLDFSSPEDIVLNKLDWYEMGNRVSDRQWHDLQGVLRIRRDQLDLEHLRRWSRELGLETLLEKALDEAGILNP